MTTSSRSTRRILVVANETVAGEALREAVEERASACEAEVLVVCPALNSRIRRWFSDDDAARAKAQARLDASLDALARIGIEAVGQVGDGDPVVAIDDALRAFRADEIIISTHPPGRSNWLERDVVVRTSRRYRLPITHVIVDLERERAESWAV